MANENYDNGSGWLNAVGTGTKGHFVDGKAVDTGKGTVIPITPNSNHSPDSNLLIILAAGVGLLVLLSRR